jgi:2-methylcitrate dehydratase PrpD
MKHPIGLDQSVQSSELPDVVVTLANYCLETSYDQLPEAVKVATQNQIMDTFGVALAGRLQPGVKELREFALDMGGKPEARIWGTNTLVPAQDAARVNATMSHALDFDDTHENSFMHPSAITIPTAFAVAEMMGEISGKEIITAVALGVDVACRLASAAQPGVSGFEHGWHNTTMYGYFASAVVAGKLMNLSPEQFISALGIAFHQISGNSQAHVDGALTKRMGPGFASYGGLLSARLAHSGVKGARGVFEGSRGFFRQYHDNHYSLKILLQDLGTQFAGTHVSFKPWPSCRGSHTAADAALTLMADLNIAANHIKTITIYNGPGEYQLLASPLQHKQNPPSVVDAQFSNPWVVSAAIVDGNVGLQHFTPDAIKRADLLRIARKIQTVEDPKLLRPGGGPGPTRIQIELESGRIADLTVTHAKGEPTRPLSSDELQIKFLDCVQLGGMPSTNAHELVGALSALPTLAHAELLSDLLAI